MKHCQTSRKCFLELSTVEAACLGILFNPCLPSVAVVKPDIQTRVPSRPEQIRKETPSSRLVPSRSEQTPKETPSPQLSREQSREPSPQASGHEAANFDENDDHITMQLEMKRFTGFIY